jgi:ATP-dependent helicase STH1/SNF2
MNDEEINDIVARTEKEAEIFREMDIERAAREETEWRAAGNSGPVPNRLMQIEELPEVYQRDEPLHVESEPEGPSGRGQRVRNTVRYTDGLTDDQWAEVNHLCTRIWEDADGRCVTLIWFVLQAVEDGQVEDVIERKSRGRGRPSNRIESSPEISTPPDDDDWGAGTSSSRKKKGKGRPSTRGTDSRSSPAPLKRKRLPGNKSMSVTPSMADEEEEVPDNVCISPYLAALFYLPMRYALSFITRNGGNLIRHNGVMQSRHMCESG